MKVALLVTNPYRDLPSQVLIAIRLCQSGTTCYLVPTQLRRRELWPLAPDLVVLDNLRVHNESLTARMVWTGMRVVIADFEGAVFPSLDRYEILLARHADVREAVSAFCAWGPALASHALEKGWYTLKQVRVTGTPRMDLYVEPWRAAARKLSSYADSYPQPFVLINGTFNRANPWIGSAEGVIRKHQENGYTEGEMRRWIEIESRAMREMVALSRRLAQSLPDLTFVYRPHPFERLETYEGQFEGLPNLHLVKKGTIEGWILRACAVVHRGSSTAIEAGSAGIPAFSPAWITAPASYPVVDAVTTQCSSEQDLIEELRNAAGGAGISEQLARTVQQVLSDWFFAVDGRAHVRIAETILECLRAHTPRVSIDRCRNVLDNIHGPGATWKTLGQAYLRRLFGLSPYWSFRKGRDLGNSDWAQSERYFGVAEVQAVIEALEPLARNLSPEGWKRAAVTSARDTGDYRFNYPHGHAVRIGPAD